MSMNDTSQEVRGIVVPLAGFETICAFDDPPSDDFDLNSHVLRALELLKTLDGKLAVIRRDNGLSDAGKTRALDALQPERVHINNVLNNVEYAADQRDTINDALAAAIVEPTRLEPADVNGGGDDREIRQWFGGLVREQRTKFLTEMAGGGHPRIALALARAPVPSIDQNMALDALRANLSPKDKDELADTEAQRAAIEWARSATGSMRRALGKFAGRRGPTA